MWNHYLSPTRSPNFLRLNCTEPLWVPPPGCIIWRSKTTKKGVLSIYREIYLKQTILSREIENNRVSDLKRHENAAGEPERLTRSAVLLLSKFQIFFHRFFSHGLHIFFAIGETEDLPSARIVRSYLGSILLPLKNHLFP